MAKAVTTAKKDNEAFKGKLLGTIGILLFFLIWHFSIAFGFVDGQFISPPLDVFKMGWDMLISGDLFVHISTSLSRVLIGLILGVATALPLGFILAGFFPKVNKFLGPLLNLFGQVNAISLSQLFIFLFGVKENSKYAVIYWSCIWPVLFTTLAGVQNIDPLLIKGAKSMGANKLTIFFKVVLPSAVTSIFTGFRMGATTAFLMLVAAEMLGANAGLGWIVHNAQNMNVMPRLYVAILTIALLALGLNYLLYTIEKSIVIWKDQGQVAD
jgi:NitT/TauT family transport system permease protein